MKTPSEVTFSVSPALPFSVTVASPGSALTRMRHASRDTWADAPPTARVRPSLRPILVPAVKPEVSGWALAHVASLPHAIGPCIICSGSRREVRAVYPPPPHALIANNSFHPKFCSTSVKSGLLVRVQTPLPILGTLIQILDPLDLGAVTLSSEHLGQVRSGTFAQKTRDQTRNRLHDREPHLLNEWCWKNSGPSSPRVPHSAISTRNTSFSCSFVS